MKKIRSWITLATLFVTVVVVTSACRKTDIQTEKIADMEGSSVEKEFFTAHRSADSEENALVTFIKRVNNKTPFVEETVKRIGYPRWDKAIKTSPTVKGAQVKTHSINGTNTANSSGNYDIYYVPFVRDSQNYVNASMVIKASASDTSVSYLCDWQYSQLQNDVNKLDDKAEYFAIFFMNLDKEVFGHNKFTITDKSLFRSNGKSPREVEFKNKDAKQNVKTDRYVEYCQEVTVSYTTCWYIGHCKGPDGSCDNCHARCTSWLSYNYCWEEWISDGGIGGGGDGSGGTGGGGTGGGPTPPEPCDGSYGNQSASIGNSVIRTLRAGCNDDPGWTPSELPLTSADIAILEELQQEKVEADNFTNTPTPCRGTKRIPGSTVFQQQATVAHLLIQEAYITSEPFGVAEYYIPNSGATGGHGFADLANGLKGEIFEIKSTSPNQIALGETEVARYVTAARVNCPPSSTFTQWTPGTQFVPINLPNPFNPSTVIHAELVAPGVISYETRLKANNPLPAPMPTSIPQIISELMKRRRQSPTSDFPTMALRYLRELSTTPQGQALVSNLKAAIATTAAVIVIGYIAEAIITEGVTLFAEAELLFVAKDLIFLVTKL